MSDCPVCGESLPEITLARFFCVACGAHLERGDDGSVVDPLAEARRAADRRRDELATANESERLVSGKDAIGSLLRSLENQARAQEDHRRGCSKRPCVACNLAVCEDCSLEFEGATVRRCMACEGRRERRELVAKARGSIPQRYGAIRFDAAELAARVLGGRGARLIQAARAAISEPLVAFVGETGAGKSTLAACMLHEVLDRAEAPSATRGYFEFARNARWINARKLRVARQQHDLGEGEAPLVREAMRASLLVLDNIEAVLDETLVDVLHHRHDNERRTWVTVFAEPDKIAEKLGGSVERRLFAEAKRFNMRMPAPSAAQREEVRR